MVSLNGSAPTQSSPLYNYGLPGLKQASGFDFEEWDVELSGDQGRRNTRAMIDTSPVIGAALLALEMLMRQVHWETREANDSREAKDIAEFVDGCRGDMTTSWEDWVGEHLGFLPWGWQWYEYEYKLREGPQDELSYQLSHQGSPFYPDRSLAPAQPSSKFEDGKFGWHRFGIRGQESLLRWEFSPDGRELLGMWQIPAPTYQLLFVPYAKSMNFRTNTRKDRPEGRSMLRNVWTSFKFSKNVMVNEGIGIERDLAGLPLAEVPIEILQAGAGNGTASDKATFAAIQNIVNNIRIDEQGGIIWPLDYDINGKERYRISLLGSSGSKQFDTNMIIGRYEQRMLMAFLADFLLIGTVGPGSRALVDPRMNLFSLTGEAFLRQSAATLNSRAVLQLMTMNQMPHNLAPSIECGRVNLVKLLDLANYVLAFSKANAVSPLAPDVIEEMLRRGDLPTSDTGNAENPVLVAQRAERAAALEGKLGPNGPNGKGSLGQSRQQNPLSSSKTASYPETWPDWLVHTVDDLMKQRPSDMPERTWSELVIDSAQMTLERNEPTKRIFEMGETHP